MSPNPDNYLAPLLTELGTFAEIPDAAVKFLGSMVQNITESRKNAELYEQGEPYRRSGFLVSGWAIKHKLLTDGRRQVIDVVLPGAIIGLHANVFEDSDHSMMALNDLAVAWFEPQEITRLFRDFPLVGMAIAWQAARGESVLMERIASLGRRSAHERMAHIFLEIRRRLRIRGLDKGNELVFPINQGILADLLGLSVVHVNRTLRVMRQSGEIDLSKHTLTLKSMERLVHTAGFDETYLHEKPMPPKTKIRLS